MSIDPAVFNSPGSLDGIVASLSDLDRRVNALATARTFIGAGSITGGSSGVITAGSITAAEIQTGNLTAASVLSQFLSAGNIETKYIVASAANIDKLQANHIAASTITATQLNVANVSAAILTANSIGATQITADVGFINKVISGMTVAGTLTATSGLSAVSGNLGTITAGTITGGQFFTAGSNPRVAMGTAMNLGGTFTNFTGLIGLDATGAVTFKIDASTGAAQFKGSVLSGATGLGNFSDTLNPSTQIVDNTIPGGKMVIDSITAREIAANVITAAEIDSTSVRAAVLTANSVNAAAIAASSITADKLSFFDGGGINLIPDSSFETSISRWTIGPNATGASSTAQAVQSAGVDSLALTCTTAGTIFAYHQGGTSAPLVRALPGATYTGSFYVYGPTARTCQVAISFFDAAQALIRTDTGLAPGGAASQSSSAGSWTRIIGTSLAAPAGTASARIQCTILGATVGEVYYIDAVQLETGNVASGWSMYIDPTVIDGSTITAATITGATIRTAASPADRVELSGTSLKVIVSSANVITLDPTLGLRTTSPPMTSGTWSSFAALIPVKQTVSWSSATRESARVFGFDDPTLAIAGAGILAPKPDATRVTWASMGTVNQTILVSENAGNTGGKVQITGPGYGVSCGTAAQSDYTSGNGNHYFRDQTGALSGNVVVSNLQAFTVGDNAVIGNTSTFGSTFAMYSHSSQAGATTYGFLHSNAGQAFINNAGGAGIYLRQDNANLFKIVGFGGSIIQNTANTNTLIVDFNSIGVKLIPGTQGWLGTSDIRMKKDIAPLGRGIEAVRTLNPVTFRLKAAGSDPRLHVGFIAQNVLPVLPEAVDFDVHEGTYGLRYTDLIPLVTQGLKDVDAAQTDSAQAHAALEARVEMLSTLLREVVKGTADGLGKEKGKTLTARYDEVRNLYTELGVL